MTPGCFLSLALLSGLVALYHQWFLRTVDPPEVWIPSGICGFIAWLCIGGLMNAWSTRKLVAAVRRARDHFAPMDGQLEAAAGPVHPHGEPIKAPLTATECVYYEYEIYRMVQTSGTANKSPSSQKVVDFAGIGVAPAYVKTDEREIGLFGFADLADFDYQKVNAPDTSGRARRLVRETAWEDCTGLKMFRGFRMMLKALGSSDDAKRHDWQMIKPNQCSWLPRTSAEESENETSKRYDTYSPLLAEKCVTPGRPIVAIGPYVAEVEGLVTQSANDNSRIRIYRGTIDEVYRGLSKSRSSAIFWSLLVLSVMHLIALGALQIYIRSSETQRRWQKEFVTALKANDLPKAERLIDRGLNLRRVIDTRGKPPLMEAQTAEVARFLIQRGADVNQRDEHGMTPLMEAAHLNMVEVVPVLIEAGADLDARSTAYGTTALVLATDHNFEEIAEMLRKAGAADDIVRRKNGQPIDLGHPAVQVAREYVLAIHQADGRRLRQLSSSARPAKFDDVDWPLWHNTRPVDPQLVAAFVREPDATVTLGGVTGRGSSSEWTLQMLLENGEWKVAREKSLMGGYRDE